MKNPLTKRFPRELKADFGKYAVIFLFMISTIGFVSGFLVADNSMKIAYDDSFDLYNIEDGHFTLQNEISDDLISKLNQEDIEIYKNLYKEETYEDWTFRIFKNRTEINLASILDGRLAEKDNEIAIDRLFAENNEISIGDTVKLDNKKFTVCGLISLSDYTALFRSNTDMMFDAQNFTVAAVTDGGFDALTDTHLKYSYSWKYNDSSLSDKERNNRAESLMKLISENAVITDFVAEADNQAIHFTGDDMGSDEAMIIWLLYIVIVIMAFVFAVTTANTIEQESTVIGTLRASGYKKSELVRHYILLPIIVTLIGAVIGNILGYTVFKDIVVDMYYGSYSLPVYSTVWSGYAFVMTTVIPCVIMLIVNLLILTKKLSLSPLKFLRRDLNKNKNKKAVHLPNFKFLSRFRIRVVLQNLHGYGIMFIGILFANVILLFSMMMTPLLEHYKADVIDNMICSHQYVLKAPVETSDADAEKYAVQTLNTDLENTETEDEITIYGIEENSDYVSMTFDEKPDGVTVSDGIMEKYGLKIGDTLKLKDKYGDKTYSFSISASCKYPAALSVFMNIDDFRNTFDKDSDYFSGYFSDKELTDIDDTVIASVITQSDMTIISDQLFDSMGNMFPMISGFAVLLYMLLVYLLSKIIIEKNALPVSMVKILGYKTGEIAKLYLASTAVVVVLSVIVSLPLSYLIIDILYVKIMSSFSGWLSFYIEPIIYLKMFVLGIISYAVVGALQFRKIKRIPMEEALKNAE